MKNDVPDRKKKLILPDWFSEPPSLPLMLYRSGYSVSEVAEIIGCDRRTAAKLIKNNLSIEEIGKWDGSHKKLAGFAGMINSFTDTRITKYSSLLSFSKDLYTLLVKEGYTGSERTVRNYLSRQKKVSIYFDSLKRKGVQYAESDKH